MIPQAYPKAGLCRHVTWRLWVCGLAGLLIAAASHDAVAVESSLSRRLMGVEWVVTVHAESAAEATAAAEAALDRVAAIERVLSDYDPDSEVSQLTAKMAREPGKAFAVSDDLAATLQQSLAISQLTHGAFDVTVGPLTGLWRQARKTGRLPNSEKLAAALAATGRDAVSLTRGADGPRVSVADPATQLDFGGIGMGYAIDEAMALLKDRGIEAALIDASGDIAVSGPPPGRDCWRVAVPPLMRHAAETVGRQSTPMLKLVHAAVATSGDAYQAVTIDGVRYSHIVDPRTGLGVAGPTAVTVIAADATTADALSTATSVLGPVEGLAIVEGLEAAAARFSWVEDGRLCVEASQRWDTFLQPQ